MRLGDSGGLALAVVAVGHAVATADWIPHVRAGPGDLYADPHVVEDRAGPGLELTELPVLAWEAGDATAGGRALAVPGDVDPRRVGETPVAVGLAVAATDRPVDLDTVLRLLAAHPLDEGIAAVLLAELSVGAVRVDATHLGLTFALVGDRRPHRGGVTVVPVGLAVAAADRIPQVRTRGRQLGAVAAAGALARLAAAVHPVPALVGRLADLGQRALDGANVRRGDWRIAGWHALVDTAGDGRAAEEQQRCYSTLERGLHRSNLPAMRIRSSLRHARCPRRGNPTTRAATEDCA